jgi:APA family basic amino acid/polyamine antiporter
MGFSMAQETQLRRELTLGTVTLSGIGIILGAGIYALIGKGAGLAGNAIWLSFIISALIAVFTGLSYAELSSLFPRAAAEYEYTNNVLGRKMAFVIGWLIIFTGIIGAAAVALGFGGYLHDLTGIPPIPSALAIIAILSVILFLGIRESATTASIFTVIECVGLILIIVIGIPFWGTVDYFAMPKGSGGVIEAAVLVFFAFIGFEQIVKLSEETLAPEKTIPRGLLLAITVSIVLYVLTAISAVSVVGWERLSASPAPFAEVASSALGDYAGATLSIIALFATANTVLLMLLASSRIAYGMADSFSLPRFLAGIHPIRRTPLIAIVTTTLIAMLFVLIGDIGFIANVTNFTVFVCFSVINLTVILLRYRQPALIAPFRVPVRLGRMPLIPLLGIISCLFFLSRLPAEILLAGGIIVAIGGILAFTGTCPVCVAEPPS